jgi:CLIP-associating protein 1/2
VRAQMNKTEGLPFKSFVPLLVANLEDADPGVRETAKTSIVELFRCVRTSDHVEKQY